MLKKYTEIWIFIYKDVAFSVIYNKTQQKLNMPKNLLKANYVRSIKQIMKPCIYNFRRL